MINNALERCCAAIYLTNLFRRTKMSNISCGLYIYFLNSIAQDAATYVLYVHLASFSMKYVLHRLGPLTLARERARIISS